MRIGKVVNILNSIGYTLRGISGSHYHFKKDGRAPLTFPVHNGKVEKLYLKDLRTIIQTEFNLLDNGSNKV